MTFDPNPFTDITGRIDYAVLIDIACNGDNEIDRVYLIDAIQKDIKEGTSRNIRELIANPVS